MIWLAFVLLVGVGAGVTIAFTIKNGIGPTPTSPRQARNMVECIQGSPALIVDLGSGWGSLAFLLARTFPTSRIVGIENSPLPYLVSRSIKRLSRLRNLEFQRFNFLDVPLPKADVFVCYLHRAAMSRLKAKLESETDGEALLIANTFAITGWTPEKVVETKDLYRSKIYCYKIPAKASRTR
ncbi:MAG TPA: class I SAM-dependent methyltransferase [Acidobacteriota bacterium]|nr:class I SAM-dependent methyltransferase [Acidobacteriota bacterium]